MSLHLDQVVVVGAGQAGFQTAHSLRELGYQGRIVLLGAEPELPYQRPPLSKAFLKGDGTEADKLAFRPRSSFAEQGIDLRTGNSVEGIDRAAGRIMLAGGQTMPYDHLVLATGARNRPLPVPGAELDGVHGLRTIRDARRLRTDLAVARRIAIVGAGFIGLEVAALAAAAGIAVTIVETSARPMSRTVSSETAAAMREAHEARGATFMLGSTAVAIHGHDGRAVAVETDDGTVVEADLVLVGIGVTPNTELAAECGLDIRRGIAAEATLLTNDPAISAVGDCVSFPSPHADGAPVLIESVQNALDGARCVAARITEQPQPLTAVPWFWSDQGPDKLQIAGLATPHDDTLVLGSTNERAFSVLCFRDGRLAGVESVNRAGDHMAARRLLASRVRPTRDEASRPGYDLREAVKALRPA